MWIEVIHLTPLDLRLIRTDSIQKGILLPKPPPVSGVGLVDALESSFARALRLFYPLAGRLASEERGDGTVTVSLRCTGEGAEFVHAAAPGVAAADIVSSIYTPSVVRDELHSFDPALGADAAVEALPLVSVQVTELADGVFVGMTLNHSVADGAAFWHFVNTWAEIHRRGVGASGDNPRELSTPAPVLQRWSVEAWPVPIPLPFGKLGDIARPVERATVRECFLTFSTASVSELTARANGEVAVTAAAAAAISPLQAVLAHLWRASCRARRMPPEQGTSYSVLIDCRGRVEGMPPGYVGNAVAFGKAKGLGWTARLLNNAEASFDEASVRESAGRWVRRPELMFISDLSSAGTALATGSSTWLDVFGNDFGWGRPMTMRSGAGNKTDGKAAVRGAGAGRERVAGAVLGFGRAREAPRRRGVHGRGELAGVRLPMQ
ncbi:putative acetyltransferase [Panicum miliaceum]|uniref:Acetyltransferase n=1 Tax=Panicum miliaceum TaxID=4540 RepID=A0A3L6PK69_PANMI|nr:putative acetyltransferase [Panicum miliaceum]